MHLTKEALLDIANVLAASGATREEIVESIQGATGSEPQRALTDEEYNIFAGAVGRAVDIMPAFRDAIALIRPFRDYTTPTLYTDRHSRVGMGSMFFLPSVTPYRRASLLLHEAMHVLNNHFTRKVDFSIDPSSDNDAKDLEINSLLNRHPKTDLSFLLLPQQEPFGFPDAKSYEQYAHYMKEKGLIRGGDPEDESAPSSGKGEPQDSEDSGEQQASEGRPEGESDPEESEEGSGDSQEGADPSDSDESGSEDSDSSGDSEGEGSEGENESNSSAPSGDSEGEGSPAGKSEEESSKSSKSGGSGADSDDQPSDASGGSSGESDSEELADEAMGNNPNPGAEQDQPGKPGASSCDHADSEREQAADDLDIERASGAEQAVARNNTIARVREEAAKSKLRGDRAALQMLQQMELAMEPPKVNWRIIFKNIISNCRDAISRGRSEHTYRRVNRRLSSGDYIFPGMIRYEPSTIMAIDTSGSMSKKDFAFLLSELESIIRSVMRTKDKFKAFSVDAAATEPKTVRSIRDLDLFGGGGTRMEMAVRSIELLPRKDIPDVFILATDGGTSWPAFRRELLKSKHRYRTVVLITQESSFDIAQSTLKGLADVVDISEKGNGYLGS